MCNNDNSNKNIVETISSLLTSICKENSNSKNINNITIRPFLTGYNSDINIKAYLEHLVKYSKVEEPTLICTMVYIDRLCKKNNYKLNFYNIYKIILSSLLVSAKFNEDGFFDNPYYAKIGGLKLNELNFIEHYFLIKIDFSLVVYQDEYDRYYSNLLKYMEFNH